MKQYIKRFYALLFLCITLMFAIAPANAAQSEDNTALPMYAAPISASCNCNVSEGPTLHIACSYVAAEDSGVTRVDITTYVEKRNLLVLWDRVDINQPGNEWVTICYGLYNSTAKTTSLPSSGTYRVVTIFEVYSGATLVDTIEKTTPNITC